VARPTLLTDLVAQQIVSAVEKGATREGAAHSARVGESTLYEWQRRGLEGEEPYASFVDRLREAEGRLQVTLVTKLLSIAVDPAPEHIPSQVKAIEALLTRLGWGKEQTAARESAANNVARDASTDLQVVESVAAAIRSRMAKAA